MKWLRKFIRRLTLHKVIFTEIREESERKYQVRHKAFLVHYIIYPESYIVKTKTNIIDKIVEVAVIEMDRNGKPEHRIVSTKLLQLVD